MNKLQPSLFPAPEISDDFQQDSRITVYQGDTYDFLRELPSNSVDLIITSPPYNVGKEYETRLSLRQYLQQQVKVIAD